MALKAAREGRGCGAVRAAAWPAALAEGGAEVAHGHWRAPVARLARPIVLLLPLLPQGRIPVEEANENSINHIL